MISNLTSGRQVAVTSVLPLGEMPDGLARKLQRYFGEALRMEEARTAQQQTPAPYRRCIRN